MNSFNLADLATNADKEKKGVWVPFMGAEFRIASIATDRYKKAIRNGTSGLPPGKVNDPKFLDPVIIAALAEHVLLEWRGEVKNGTKPLECTPENRLLLCQNHTFREWLATQAANISNFQEADAAEESAALSEDS